MLFAASRSLKQKAVPFLSQRGFFLNMKLSMVNQRQHNGPADLNRNHMIKVTAQTLHFDTQRHPADGDRKQSVCCCRGLRRRSTSESMFVRRSALLRHDDNFRLQTD